MAPKLSHQSRLVAFLASQPLRAEVEFAVPAAPGEGDDAYVFLEGFSGSLPYGDGYETLAAFLLYVEGENMDPDFPEDVDPTYSILVDVRTAASVSNALCLAARLLGRRDLTFTLNQALTPAAGVGERNRAEFPESFCALI